MTKYPPNQQEKARTESSSSNPNPNKTLSKNSVIPAFSAAISIKPKSPSPLILHTYPFILRKLYKLYNLTNFRNLLYYLLLLLLPTQLGKHFWPPFSVLLGIRVDYLSPTLYLTDILIFFMFILYVITSIADTRARRGNPEKKQFFNFKEFLKTNSWRLPTLFFAYLLVSIIIQNVFIFTNGKWQIENEKYLLNSSYGLLKFLEYSFLFFYISKIWNPKKFNTLAFLVSFPVIGESLLAIAQYLHQSSIGGLLYFFGERTFTSDTPGIANASIHGQLILRPYGTLPHPNVLAGYLLIMLILVATSLNNDKNKTNRASTFVIPVTMPAGRQETGIQLHQCIKMKVMIMKLIKILALIFGSITICLTLSRSTILLWAVICFCWLINTTRKHKNQTLTVRKTIQFISKHLNINHSLKIKNLKLKIIIASRQSIIALASMGFLLLLALWSPLLYRFTQTSFSEESFIQRKDLTENALSIISNHPLIGVGLHNFLPTLATIRSPLSPTYYLQPVHNIFLLWTAETGLIGLSFLLYFLLKTYIKLKSNYHPLLPTPYPLLTIPCCLVVILILGLFDHYFLTLQQGHLLTAIILGLAWSYAKK